MHMYMFLCGHGNAMGGVIVDGRKFDWAKSGVCVCVCMYIYVCICMCTCAVTMGVVILDGQVRYVCVCIYVYLCS